MLRKFREELNVMVCVFCFLLCVLYSFMIAQFVVEKLTNNQPVNFSTKALKLYHETINLSTIFIVKRSF